MRRTLRLVVGLMAVGGVAWVLTQSSGAQVPPSPTFTVPTFTVPTFPPLPTTTPPPTMPPPTTTPPPTMPPPTTTPPPTMPPTTISTPNIDAEIEALIDRLEQFGDVFSEVIEELRALEARF